MAADKTLVLVTGANGGIGFELVAQLLADSSKHVILCSRSKEKGEAAIKDLESRNLPGSVELVQLDVSDWKSIEAAAKTVGDKHGRLDVLVNNAATALPSDKGLIEHVMSMGAATGPMPLGPLADTMATCFATNATGPLLMGEAFLPLLEKAKSGTPRIINVSSGAGSITVKLNPELHKGPEPKAPWYHASKTAENMVNACQVRELGPKGFKVFVYCPGFTVSNLSGENGFNKVENGAKPTSQGTAPMVKMINGEVDELVGKFPHEKNGGFEEYAGW